MSIGTGGPHINTAFISLELCAAQEIVKGYTKPGQFLQVRLSETGKAAFLAIASAPGATKSTLELLVKPVEGATAGDLCGLEKGIAVLYLVTTQVGL